MKLLFAVLWPSRVSNLAVERLTVILVSITNLSFPARPFLQKIEEGFSMGVYYSLFNHTRKEKVILWKLGGLAKLVEIKMNDPHLEGFLRGELSVENPNWKNYGRWATENT